MINVLLADDHAVVRGSILSILAREPEIRIVGEAGDFSEAIKQAHAVRPDVMILDLHMPCDPDLSFRDIRSQINSCGARVLGISFAYDDDAKSLASTIGATELLDKVKLGHELIPSIMRVAAIDDLSTPITCIESTNGRDSDELERPIQGRTGRS